MQGFSIVRFYMTPSVMYLSSTSLPALHPWLLNFFAFSFAPLRPLMYFGRFFAVSHSCVCFACCVSPPNLILFVARDPWSGRWTCTLRASVGVCRAFLRHEATPAVSNRASVVSLCFSIPAGEDGEGAWAFFVPVL